MSGVTRKVQETGRVTIPRTILDAAYIKPGDDVELYLGQEGLVTVIVIRPASNVCLFCKHPVFRGQYVEHKDRVVCHSCIKEMKGIDYATE